MTKKYDINKEYGQVYFSAEHYSNTHALIDCLDENSEPLENETWEEWEPYFFENFSFNTLEDFKNTIMESLEEEPPMGSYAADSDDASVLDVVEKTLTIERGDKPGTIRLRFDLPCSENTVYRTYSFFLLNHPTSSEELKRFLENEEGPWGIETLVVSVSPLDENGFSDPNLETKAFSLGDDFIGIPAKMEVRNLNNLVATLNDLLGVKSSEGLKAECADKDGNGILKLSYKGNSDGVATPENEATHLCHLYTRLLRNATNEEIDALLNGK